MLEKELESIWVEGIPSKIEKDDLLNLQEVLNICLQYFIKDYLKDKEYNLEGINPNPNQIPHVLLTKGNKKYAVIIVPCVYPRYHLMQEEVRIQFVKDCQEKNAIPLYCPVLIASYDALRAEQGLMLKGDLFNVRIVKQKILNQEAKQDLTLQSLDFEL
ncbi:MAG: hypothetical protein K2I42_02305 [Anaeroplasmataceae bacterium]|nr:hypothetical protein [Anaeroplasmataceae bacterium]